MPTPDLKIPGYRILEVIGSGGMATVYLAEQELLKRKVALKVMSPRLMSDPVFCERFLSEAQIVARLSHPHIVTIHEVAVSEDTHYMAMEYVKGETLHERITKGVSLHDSLMILKQVAEALGYAHQEGFLHRDVKPANILFRDDQTAVLSDFGIAKDLEGGSHLTQVGFALGTPDYMSPEQAMGRALDGRSDLYSLGMVFYEMCTVEGARELKESLSQTVPSFDRVVPRLPPSCACYQPILDGLMAGNPEARFSSAQTAVDAIAEIDRAATAVDGGISSAIAYSQSQPAHAPAAKSTPRAKRTGIVLGAFLVVGLTVLSYMLYRETEVPVETLRVSEPLDDESVKRIDRLLKVADAHLKMGRLTEPRGSNAYEAYKSVLAIDARNEQALAGLAQVEKLAGADYPQQ